MKLSLFLRSVPLALTVFAVASLPVFASFVCLTTAFASGPAQEGAESNLTTAGDEDAIFSRATDGGRTASGFDAWVNDRSETDTGLPGVNWRRTGDLNIPRSSHTATLLQNAMVLVAGGIDSDGIPSELYDPVAHTWTLTGNLNTWRYGHT